ncbi:hypothetical protein EVAR_78326_1 [Eumeta japonica]|uniref:Chitin-binding type-4 domain-containing protein n=1 Tax=Eumeta variegata TaxID=151549 RepID=A0A4C1T374_EUMVA|nr:hypothetical protein EVAR_78326_1 [Eumeta japonica]
MLSIVVVCAHAHGRVLAPVGRASAWRLGFPSEPNYDDDGLNCGGFSHQWDVNGGKRSLTQIVSHINPTTLELVNPVISSGKGWTSIMKGQPKCGICGDAFDLAEPRPHELGGRYGQGFIVEHYKAGSVFEATIELSAYHRGYWEFKICPDPQDNGQECFDNYVLELEEGGTKYYPVGSATYVLNYRLPVGLECEHCVLQWRYTAGNNWGICEDGTQGLA